MNAPTTIRLALVDDEQLIVTLLEQFFQTQSDVDVVLTANSGASLQEQLKTMKDLPQVLLLDLRLPQMDGVAIAQWLQKNYPDIQIVVVSSHYQKTFMGYLLKAGVSGFVPKGVLPQQLLEVVRTVHEQGYYFLPEQVDIMRKQITSKAPKPQLDTPITITTREKEILELLCQQKTAQEIADTLYITRRTVEGHKNNLLSKTGMKNTAGLIVYAIKEGIIDLQGLHLE